MICAGNDRQFAALCEALGAPELADDERFATNPRRVANRTALRPLLERRLATASVGQWAERLRAAGVPAGAVNDLAGAFELASELELDPVDEHDGVRTVRSPLGLRSTPPSTRRRPPRLDEQGDEIRSWLAGGRSERA
jgi:formyl-CoA transferase